MLLQHLHLHIQPASTQHICSLCPLFVHSFTHLLICSHGCQSDQGLARYLQIPSVASRMPAHLTARDHTMSMPSDVPQNWECRVRRQPSRLPLSVPSPLPRARTSVRSPQACRKKSNHLLISQAWPKVRVEVYLGFISSNSHSLIGFSMCHATFAFTMHSSACKA